MGDYKNPLVCDENNLHAVSEKLQNVKIICCDYRESANFIDKNTFVYLDPPYRPVTSTSNFTAYTKNLFDDSEQIALAGFVDEMHRKEAKIVISNSDPKNSDINDNFLIIFILRIKLKELMLPVRLIVKVKEEEKLKNF